MLQTFSRRVGVFALGALLALGLSTPNAHAVDSPFELNIEPVVGYERVEQVLPTVHTVNRLFYGAIVTAGVLMVSLESQYTHAVSQETVSGTDISSTGDKVKLGVRSGFKLGSLLSLYLRAGGEASQETTVQTVSGVSTTDYTGVVYRPYAGLGGKANLGSKLFASGDVVAVFRGFSSFSQIDLQATAGFGVRLP